MDFFSSLCFPAWSRSGVETGSTSQEATAIRERGLECQLPEKPAASRSFWSRLFGCFFSRVKKESSNPVSCYQWPEDPYSIPSLFHIGKPQISIVDETDCAPTNDDGKAATHESISLESVGPSGTSTADETDSATTKFDGNIANHDSISNTESAGSFEMSVDKSGESGESAEHFIRSPPKVHTAALFNDDKVAQWAASRKTSNLYADHQFRTGRNGGPALEARTRTHPSNSSESCTAIASSDVESPGHATSGISLFEDWAELEHCRAHEGGPVLPAQTRSLIDVESPGLSASGPSSDVESPRLTACGKSVFEDWAEFSAEILEEWPEYQRRLGREYQRCA